ncbi:DUF58 domain-containing protein [Roseimaritima ulvae]|uniref:DUF58 domain-containing protein n=1 Tax=Roseimaritima ulvae TaxID=980254 RepID=A0A5B9QS07_9BACT|nr:DUF58 domain-containing protein [Roseimaritima ulvae]QEG41774.1 hypothetical protein UC8_38000 [Roseimaritima ulvae]
MAAVSPLSPEAINQIKRLDLRARMVVRGFLQGLHASPYHGFSVQFSEHRRYNRGDDPKLIDWLVYAKTDKYYIKRFEAETNLTGYLVMDLSRSMGFTASQQMTKFEYCICLAASLCYLMIMQQDPVGLITFGDKVRASVPARSRRGHLGDVMAHLTNLQPEGTTDLPACLNQVAAMMRHKSLIMLFSDLLGDPEPVFSALARLRHGGHDVILFHVLDEAEVHFPYDGAVEFEDPETGETISVDATGFREDYLKNLTDFQDAYRRKCSDLRIDYVPMDTSMPFDTALTEYLISRQARF